MDGVKSFNIIHADVYETAQKNLPAKKYNNLINPKDKYRIKMAEDAAAFETQLPFFNIKPVYLIMIFIFFKLGTSLTYATLVPSLIAFFFMNLVAYFWCKKFSLSPAAFAIVLTLICIATIPLATRSNPDGVACLFIMVGSFFFLEAKNLFLTVLFLVLAILTRPESIIFSFILYAIILAGKWKRKIPVFISAIYILILVLVYFIPLKIMSNPGWSTLFYHAFVDNTANPLVKQTITIPLYLQVIRQNILNFKGIAAFIFLAVLCTQVFQFKTATTEKAFLYKIFFIVVLISAIIKFLIFPMGSLRFIIPPFLLMFFVLIKEYELRHTRNEIDLNYSKI
jgi:hypothetical protein